MPSLPVVSGAETIRVLQKLGFSIGRAEAMSFFAATTLVAASLFDKFLGRAAAHGTRIDVTSIMSIGGTAQYSRGARHHEKANLSRCIASLFASAAICLASNSAARVAPRTDAFVVNTFTASDQFTPHVVASGEDDFVVVWVSLGQDGGEGGIAGVFGQHFAGNGTNIGDEFQVNSFVNGSQYEPSIGASDDGRIAASWISFGQDGDAHGVFARRFDANMIPEGPDFQANTYAVGAQDHPDLSVARDGTIVVTWESRTPTSDGAEIFAQRFSPEGIPLGSEFQVNTVTTNVQRFPKVAHDGAGNFMLVWRGGSTFDSEDDPDGSGAGVFGRAYGADGLPKGPDFVVPAFTMYSQYSPAIAGRPDGGFVVAWTGNGTSDDGTTSFGVFSTAVSSDGMRLQETDTFLGYSLTDGDEWISATVLGNDLQLVAWDKRDTFDQGARVVGRLRTASGQTVGEEFTLAQNGTGSTHDVQVASLGATNFVAVWSDFGDPPIDGSGGAVSARIFSAFTECGDASTDGKVSTLDALVALRTAVGSANCSPCICDVDGSEEITVTDALLVLRTAVGLDTDFGCVDCIEVSRLSPSSLKR